VEGSGTCERGFVCPFHGWCYGIDGKNTAIPRRPATVKSDIASTT